MLRTCLCLWLTLYPYLLASTLHSSPLPSDSSFLDSQSFCPLVFSPLTSLCRLSSLSRLLPAFFFTLCFLSSPLRACSQASSLKNRLLAECWSSVKEERRTEKQRGGGMGDAHWTRTRVAVSLCGGECHTLKHRREKG